MYFLLKYHETHIKSLTISWTAQSTMPQYIYTIHTCVLDLKEFIIQRKLYLLKKC